MVYHEPKQPDEETLRLEEQIMWRIDYWHTTLSCIGTRKLAVKLRSGVVPWGGQLVRAYIKMECGHMYLTATIDWYSRIIMGWELSDTLETAPVLETVRSAVERFGIPTILNSDQGSQFTSAEYKAILKSLYICQSMGGKSRWADNIMIEHWFCRLKTKLIYVNEFRCAR